MADFVYGKHTKFRVSFNNGIWAVNTKTWSVEEVAVEAEDGVNGEDRDRLQKLTKYFRCMFDCYEDGSSQILQNLLANQANEDANLPQIALSGAVIFEYLTGGAPGAFALKRGCLGPLKMNSGGRTTVFSHALSFRCQYFTQVKSVGA